MGTVSIRKAILMVIIACILSSASTLGVIYAAPSLILGQVSRNQPEILRFVEPSKQNLTDMELYQDVANFVWTPTNLTSNAILEVYVQAEYYYENPPQYVWEWGEFWWELKLHILVDEFRYGDDWAVRRSAANLQEWEQEGSFKWEQTFFKAQPHQGLWITPNQNNYTLTVRAYHRDRTGSSTHTYLRNINIIMEVIDGIPAEPQ